MSQSRIEITRPDDWHLHLRDGDRMAAVLPHTARRFGRAIVMPNLTPPISTTARALKYRKRILRALDPDSSFEPLMTLYLTDQTTPEEIDKAMASGFVFACKLYPAGVTTNSASGVTAINSIMPVLERMTRKGMPLLVHGEVNDPAIDVFDRETSFIEAVLIPLREKLPELRIVFEHISSAEGVHYVYEQEENVAATITAHHLLLTRNDLLVGGLKPHNYCAPVAKSRNDRKSLVEAATSGDPRFFLGTDSAPHAKHEKESACGCAGIYTAHAAIELYAEVFETAGALSNFEAFASFNGADFYGLPRNTDTIAIDRQSWKVPNEYEFAGDKLVPLRAGTKLAWRLVDE